MISLKIQFHNHFIKYHLLSKFGVSYLTMDLAGYEGGERKRERGSGREQEGEKIERERAESACV